jgi:predicted transcriptional regulator
MHARRTSRRNQPFVQETVRLSADGLAKVLGDLEARVMQTVWHVDRPATAREVHEVVSAEHDVAIHTVITVLNKLVRKRLLRRRKRAHLLHYEAAWSEAEFMKLVSRRVVEGILSFSSSAVASSFVDVLAERDPQQLAELQQLIRRRLEEAERDADSS